MRSELILARRALLDELTATLRTAGVPEPRREVLSLWRDLAGLPSAEVLVRPEEPVDPELAAGLRRASERRASGEPLAHVSGRIGFRHLVLRSDRRALIPRPETEGLVDLLLSRVRTGVVADVGTGTGALALALAGEGAFETVLGIDLSAGAIALAAENRAATGIRIALVQGDLCTALRPGAFDALVSNPPYLSAAEYSGLEPGVRDWEPGCALVGGWSGLEATNRLLEAGRDALRPGGWLAVEVDCNRAREGAHRAVALGWTEVTVHADLFGRDRYLLARRSVAT
jgi:release factor glutamine methyltransferase